LSFFGLLDEAFIEYLYVAIEYFGNTEGMTYPS